MRDLLDKLRKRIHPILLNAMPSKITMPIKILNDMPTVSGNKLFAINHSCVLDAPVSGWVIKEHFYYLVGKQHLKLIDRIFFHLNGVVFVDRKNKKHRKKSFKKMQKKLLEGKSLLIFPEGTWNLTPSKPLLPLNWGIIELAKQTKTPIIPLIMEYYPDCCHIKYGQAIYIDKETDKATGILQLEEAMSTLRWDIWETFPRCKRENIVGDEWQKEVEARLAEYPKLDFEYEQSCIRKL